MNRRLRRAVFLALLALGALGLLATGSGVWAGSPWPWLVVLALGVAAQVAGDHYDQRLRLARRTEKRLVDLANVVKLHRDLAASEAATLRRELDEHRALLTPEGVKHLHGLVERMAKDLTPIKEAFDSGRFVSGMKSMMERR